MNIVTEPIAKKRKRFNKNKKKAWRKKINISDIDEHLEDQRREERLGGPLGSRLSEELFSLDYGITDKKASKRKTHVSHFVTKEGLKPLFVRNKEQPLKCHQFLKGLPGAKAISVKKGVMKQKEKRIIKTARKLSKADTPKAKLQQIKIQHQRRADLAKKKKMEKVNFNQDLWNSDKDELSKFNAVSKSFLEEPVQFYIVETKQNKVKTPTIRFEKPCLLPAVVVPKSGASYNPSFDDHQKLMTEALEVENQKIKKEEKVKRMITKYLPSSKDGITETEMIVEMSEGLPLDKNLQHLEMFAEEEEENEDEEEQNYIGHKKVEKKSKQTRRKAKTLQVKEQKRLKKKEINQKESNIFRIKSYTKDLKLMEKKSELLREKRLKKRSDDRFRTKQLSRHEFKDEDIVVALGNEIADSVRTVQPAGNALESVFKSFQRRNLIDKRKRGAMKSKKKTKMYYKSTAKGKLDILNEKE